MHGNLVGLVDFLLIFDLCLARSPKIKNEGFDMCAHDMPSTDDVFCPRVHIKLTAWRSVHQGCINTDDELKICTNLYKTSNISLNFENEKHMWVNIIFQCDGTTLLSYTHMYILRITRRQCYQYFSWSTALPIRLGQGNHDYKIVSSFPRLRIQMQPYNNMETSVR